MDKVALVWFPVSTSISPVSFHPISCTIFINHPILDIWPNYATPLYSQKLTLASPTSGSRSVSIVRSWPQTTELSLLSLTCVILILTLSLQTETKKVAYKICSSVKMSLSSDNVVSYTLI
jgi:hypothetical protein